MGHTRTTPRRPTWKASNFQLPEIVRNTSLLPYTLQQPDRLTRRLTVWQRTNSDRIILAAISATAAQFANRDGGGPSPATVRKWGEADGLVAAPRRRAKSTKAPKRGNPVVARAVQTPASELTSEIAPVPGESAEAPAAAPIGIAVDAAETTAPAFDTPDERDAEIARLIDLVTRSDTDLIERNKFLEREVALLRPLVELYWESQKSNR
ncbi:hypothetical protein ACIGO9_30225 [Nocardia asteroides]|uniref:hypothetical protein n=1 Tax=Nocardia asteroides TaxID=1824 RepID=UPI0037CC463D